VCPNSCSGRGSCTESGECICHANFGGPACDQVVEAFPCPHSCVCPPTLRAQNLKTVDLPCLCLRTLTLRIYLPRLHCLVSAGSGHGRCVQGACVCDVGFHGDDCSTARQPEGNACPSACSGHGRCTVDGSCACFAGFAGAACGILVDDDVAPPRQPSAASLALLGPTASAPPSVLSSSGSSSTLASCALGCSGHGSCDHSSGLCVCQPGYDGIACERVAFTPSCAANCSGHGTCTGSNGCTCRPSLHYSWEGEACATLSQPQGCAHGCSGHGTCIVHRTAQPPGRVGHCACRDGYAGADCSIALACPARCNGRGDCVGGRCECERGWKGSACEAPRCASDCSGHGRCLPPVGAGALGACLCAGGWAGIACDVWRPHCPNDCSGHGQCVDGRCACDDGFIGDACGERRGGAPSASLSVALGDESCGALLCNAHGTCQRGRTEGTVLCACYDGYGGPRCMSVAVGAPRT
jgi:tenascin